MEWKQFALNWFIPFRSVNFDDNYLFIFFQAGLATAPARAVSAVKNMNIPQQIKDMKLPDLPNISGLKF